MERFQIVADGLKYFDEGRLFMLDKEPLGRQHLL